MIAMIRHAVQREATGCERMEQVAIDTRHNRNAKEDIQKGVEYVFELMEKIKALHPVAQDVIISMLKIGY